MTTATEAKARQNGTQKKSQTTEKKSTKQLPVTTTTEMQRELSVSEKMEKVNQLKQLLDRREILVTKRSELRKFKFSEDENSSVLTLVDQNNNEFRTANSNLIEVLMNYLDDLITEKINEVTDQILAYEF